MKKAILFDLDGTLLPMDQDIFVKTYFGLMAKRMAQFGYKPDELIHTIWTGISAVIKNDGTLTNEDLFWKCFAEVYGDEKHEMTMQNLMSSIVKISQRYRVLVVFNR